MQTPLPGRWTCLPLRTPTLPPATHTNTVLIEGDGAFVVVDPGSPYDDEQARLLGEVVGRLERGLSLTGVCLTHHHGDHLGGLAGLVEGLAALGVQTPVWTHALTLEATGPLPGEVRLLDHRDRLALGSLWLEAIHTPGHTRGHLTLFDPEARVAYGGDMVASVGTIIIDPPDGDMAAYLDSLGRLLALDLEVLVPSHGLPISQVRPHLEGYIAHRLERERLVLAALTPEPRPIDLLIPASYPGLTAALYPLARRSLLAHLLKLSDEGRAGHKGGKWWRLEP